MEKQKSIFGLVSTCSHDIVRHNSFVPFSRQIDCRTQVKFSYLSQDKKRTCKTLMKLTAGEILTAKLT
jgi:hypothetical protein